MHEKCGNFDFLSSQNLTSTSSLILDQFFCK
jgi:hypothetical protein